MRGIFSNPYRGYRTTSTAALQVLAGIPPTDLLAKREATLCHILRLRQNSALWEQFYYADQYETKLSSPLCHPAAFDLSRQINLQHILSTSAFEIYTDGSKMSMGTGSGLCIMQGSTILREWRRRLGLHNSIYQAELMAIKKAIALSYMFSTQTTIYCDSMSSLMAISNPDIRYPLVRSIQISLLHLPPELRPILSWIPAHKGHVGNERADTTR
ncbi:uncharacterized protein LOC118197273 [Stegodyphus dumicola]|uniref:uncharacterized protein LOC118197273 n=1 Tax=Stegodyphus dumicola TaxID=202533 RepID=UPI0015A7D6B9|nr:uncharacterized protein LOC118197273 [Stegodyphus dumicola]